ncbi:MAG: EamA family transporter [Halobacteriales archaeon]
MASGSLPPSVYGIALVPAILWGLSPILSKRGMAAGGGSLQASLTVVTVDSVIYWLVLAGFTGSGTLFAEVDPMSLSVFIVAGIVGTALGRLAVFAGVDRVGASINSAGISTRPLFATTIAFFWLGETVGPLTVVGVVVLVIGLIVLTLSKGGDITGWRSRDLFFPLTAAFAFGLGNVIRRFGLTRTDVTTLQAVTLNETAALIALLRYTIAVNRTDVFRAPTRTYLYFAGSGLLTAVALLSLFEAFNRAPVAIVDSLGATAPLFTTLFSYFLLRDLERVTRGVVVGAGLIVIGATLITVI